MFFETSFTFEQDQNLLDGTILPIIIIYALYGLNPKMAYTLNTVPMKIKVTVGSIPSMH